MIETITLPLKGAGGALITVTIDTDRVSPAGCDHIHSNEWQCCEAKVTPKCRNLAPRTTGRCERHPYTTTARRKRPSNHADDVAEGVDNEG